MNKKYITIIAALAAAATIAQSEPMLDQPITLSLNQRVEKVKFLPKKSASAQPPVAAAPVVEQPVTDSGAIEFKPGGENQDPRTALLPMKRKKEAILWALNYMNNMWERAINNPDSINPSAKAIRRDVQKEADKRYPNSQELNALWFEYAIEEVGSVSEEAKDILEENMIIKDAFAEVRQLLKDRREQVSQPGFEIN